MFTHYFYFTTHIVSLNLITVYFYKCVFLFQKKKEEHSFRSVVLFTSSPSEGQRPLTSKHVLCITSLFVCLCVGSLLSVQLGPVCSASLYTHQYFTDTLTHSSLETSLARNLLLFSLSLWHVLIRLLFFYLSLCL